jgi:uncharacterized membrane protein
MATGARRRYIDWMRGVAVLVMIEAHVFDAWTRLADRTTLAYRDLVVLAGFAAPLFLWLAGLAAVLSAERAVRRTGSRRAATELVCKRGLEVFILAFLFRLQAFVVSPGSVVLTIFRVDILNIMGPSILAVGLVWGITRGPVSRTLAFAVLTTLVAMVTPLVRTAEWVNALPIWVQWHIRPAGDNTVFTAFPWSGFAFGGAAVGALIDAVKTDQAERRLHAALLVTGAVLVGFGFFAATLPSIYQQSSFWTSSPTYFAIRAGLLVSGLSAFFALEQVLSRRQVYLSPLERLGRSSLFIYWIHVELVYGYASWAWRKRLPLPYTVVAYVGFCLLMYAAIVLRDRFVRTRFWQSWRASPETATV